MNGGTLPQHYYAITSAANLSNGKTVNSKKVDFKDFSLFADSWIEQSFWPQQ